MCTYLIEQFLLVRLQIHVTSFRSPFVSNDNHYKGSSVILALILAPLMIHPISKCAILASQ